MPQMNEDRQVRVNVRVAANVAGVRQEKLNGRDVIIVPSATLPDDVVMNEIRYPASEIEASYKGLDRTPAPLGHPKINGAFVSARDPEGINLGWIGAWNTNVRRESGTDGRNRVLLDKVIDVEVAERSEGGRRVLAAIRKGEPIHTSTGLLTRLEAATGDVGYKFTAREIIFDHDAVLLDEDGAATPAQGVGIFVNSAGKAEEIEVINSDLGDDPLDWAVDSALTSLMKRQPGWASRMERVKTALIEAFSGSEREPSTHGKEKPMTVSKEQFDELSARVNALSEAVTKNAEAQSTSIAEAVTNAIKPLTDNLAEMQANAKAQADAEKAELVGKVVKANILSETAANELTVNALKELAATIKTGKAAALNGAFTNGAGERDLAALAPKGD